MIKFIAETGQTAESFDFQPINKKIDGFTTFTNTQLEQLILELELKLSKDDLIEIEEYYRGINTEPSSLELIAIDKFRRTDKYILNSYINKIEILSQNPHINKSLDLYNKINLKLNKPREKTIESFLKLAISELSSQNLGTIFHNKNDDSVVFCCKGTGDGENNNLSININHSTSFDELISSVESVVYKSSLDGFEPLAIIENTINSETSHKAISKIADDLNVACMLQIPFYDNSICFEGINEVTMLKTSHFRLKKAAEHNNGDRILLVCTNQKDHLKGIDFCRLANEGAFYHFNVKPYTCEAGLFNALVQIAKGIDILFEKLPLKTESFENFFMNPTHQYIVAIVKPEEKYAFTEFCEQRSFSIFDIGKITKSKAIRILKGPLTIFNLTHKVLWGNFHNETVLKIELDNMIEPCSKLRLNKTQINKPNDDACLKFDIFKGGKTALPQFIGERQNTKSQAYMFVFDECGFDKLKLFFSSTIESNNKTIFITVLESMIMSVLKLVLLGVPTHHIATTISLYYPTNIDDMGKVLEAILAVFYSQMILSIPNIKADIKKSDSCKSLQVISHAIGYSNSTTIANQFKVGQKLFYFPIEKDDYGVPDLKYFLKLTSAINMQIMSGNIQSAIVVEKSINKSIMSSIIGNGLGFSLAFSEDRYLNGNEEKGGLLISVSDIKEMGALKSLYVGVVDATGVFRDVKGQPYNANYDVVKKQNIDMGDGKVTSAFTTQKLEQTQFFNKYLHKPEVLILTFDKVSGDIFRGICHKAGFSVNLRDFTDTIYINDMFVRGLRIDISKANIIVLCGQNTVNNKFSGDLLYSILKRPEIIDAINEVAIRNLGLILGCGEGTRALFKLGYLPYGNSENAPIKFQDNNVNNIKALTQRIRISSNDSIWLSKTKIGSVYKTAFPENMMKIKVDEKLGELLIKNNQITSQYIDDNGDITSKVLDNSLGSSFSMSSIMSPNGRVLGFFTSIEKTYHIPGGTAELLDGMFKNAKEYFFSPDK
ncbi:MAG TPA: phosphoribosylformylglycinamidine synthase subunit PurQ [Clostridia bacterium]|jgi:phosphoribosylformylglycinamidine (FGAM) synthase-like amidotransferase family enzyme|nr:phosphoribosylformylglycinamidine synthase subunit PurQ [Clostridia bacterium]